MEIITWLLSIDPNVDYTYRNYDAFRYSVFHNHFDVTKFLYEKIKNFDDFDDYDFHVGNMKRLASENNNPEMVIFLDSIFTKEYMEKQSKTNTILYGKPTKKFFESDKFVNLFGINDDF
jgi:hypothetical protein